MGFDTLAESTVLSLQKEFPEIQLVLVLPYLQQAKSWKMQDLVRYKEILRQVGEENIFYVSQSYHRGCMQQRNRRLVDDSELCVAYCTQATGGTAYEKKGVEVRNLADTL